MKTLSTAGAVLVAATTAAFADTLPLSYEAFEVSIPHFDLEDCPTSMNVDNGFCRATFHSEEVHIFAFSYDGDSPLIAFKSFSGEKLGTLLK
jgi:hypothetical protein